MHYSPVKQKGKMTPREYYLNVPLNTSLPFYLYLEATNELYSPKSLLPGKSKIHYTT